MDNTSSSVLMNTSVHYNISDPRNMTGYIYYNSPGIPYYEEDEIQKVLYTYLMPLFICLGIIGNSLTCFAVTRAPLKSVSVSVYVFAYNLSTLIALIFNSVLHWCFDVLEVAHFQTHSEVFCRIWQFVSRIMTYSGIWFVVCLSIDRYIAMWHPHYAQSMCNPFMAKIAIVCTLTGLTVVSIHSMWLYQLDQGYCWLNIALDANHEVWLWVSGMLYSLVPLLFIFLFGNLLIVRLCLKHRGNLLPDSSDVDMDLTYFVMILSMIYFVLNFPAIILSLIHGAWPLLALNRAIEIAQLPVWISHLCPFFILLGCSKAFRTILASIPEKCYETCWQCIRRRSVHTEMMSVGEDYVPVSNSSTTL